MSARTRKGLTYANVVASIALFVALGDGTAVARSSQSFQFPLVNSPDLEGVRGQWAVTAP